MKREAKAVIFAIAAFVAPAIVHAEHECWIERVVQTADGVALHFTQLGVFQVAVSRLGSPVGPEMYWVANGIAKLPGSLREVEIVLATGDEASAFEMHSSCMLRVEKRDDQLGVAAQPQISLPLPEAGRSNATKTYFFVAE
ncbi:hypothetical protein [Ralstonia mannitolilytica]|uniref:hypothetical protein n=1 Tax=Ralstonia mannitolilytica TaxID=105219 RepID=UPI0013DDFCCC|nr:hypothetical protein G5A69_05600 [Ralstonia mannitolilytica]